MNETKDIVLDLPPEESVFTVTLRWDELNVTGGNLINFTVFLEAIGETDINVTNSKRQINNFLNDCIIGNAIMDITVSPDRTELDVDASKFINEM